MFDLQMSRLINTRSSLWREAKSRTGANLGQACANALKAYTASTKPSTQELAHLTGKVRLRACGYKTLTSTPQLARFLREMQQYELAESFFQKALHLTETVFGEYSKQAGKMNYMLAECYWNQSKMDEAQPYCEKSLAIRERILGGHHLEVAMSLCGLGGTQFYFSETIYPSSRAVFLRMRFISHIQSRRDLDGARR